MRIRRKLKFEVLIPTPGPPSLRCALVRFLGWAGGGGIITVKVMA
jgi:hypothetical protein